MSDAITSRKMEQREKLYMDSRFLFEWMSICVLSPAHECEMRDRLVDLLIVEHSLILDPKHTRD